MSGARQGGDSGLGSPSDAATTLIAVPVGYVVWLLWGDPHLIDPQIAGPLIGSLVLGLKKGAQATQAWEIFRKRRILRRVAKALHGHGYYLMHDPDNDPERAQEAGVIRELEGPIDALRKNASSADSRWANVTRQRALSELIRHAESLMHSDSLKLVRVGREVHALIESYVATHPPTSEDSADDLTPSIKFDESDLELLARQLSSVMIEARTGPDFAASDLMRIIEWGQAATSEQIEAQYGRIVKRHIAAGAQPARRTGGTKHRESRRPRAGHPE